MWITTGGVRSAYRPGVGSDIASWGRARLGRHGDLAVDLVLAALAVTVMVQSERGSGAGRILFVAGVCAAAIVGRRRWPVPTLLLVTAATMVTVGTRPAAAALVLLLGVLTYATALHPVRRRPWAYPLGVSAAVVGVGLIVDTGAWWSADSFGTLTWICGGAALGDAIRNRRAYIAEVTERARQAEQTREEEARRRVKDERLRIARELHDVVAHHIAVINVQAGAAGHVIARHPEQAGPVLERIREASDTVLREIKTVIGVLREPGEVTDTAPSPGLSRLPELLSALTAAGFRVDLREEGEPRDLPAIVDLAAYRIAQESLTNAHRYGDDAAELRVVYGPATVSVEVVNRVGPPRAPAGSGFGLIGMRERAAAAHGTVTAGPAPGGRFRVHATLPTDQGAS